jgi:hypothetical protein
VGESTRYLGVAETAKLIRKALKDAFPATKFGVRSKSYSGGASINVTWTDGPTVKLVNSIAKQFEGGGFDGMIDLKFNYDHWLLPDGSTVIAHSPGTEGSKGMYSAIRNAKPHDDAELVSFGADYVFTDRAISLEFAKRLVAQIAAYVGAGELPELVATDWSSRPWKFADEKVGNQSIFPNDRGSWDGPHWTWECCVRRASEDATKFAREVPA